VKRGCAMLLPLLLWIAAPNLAAKAPEAGVKQPAQGEPLEKNSQGKPVATFSIVAYDPKTGDLGVAVESKFFSVGSVVPWAETGVGAIATQSFANATYGPRGLALLKLGITAQQVVDALISNDPGRSRRQVGIVDAQGNAATYTGAECLQWAGGVTGKDKNGWPYAAQGNILAGAEVVQAMARTFESAEGELADKLVAALATGQAAGGDARGQQSAALLVVRPKGGYAGFNDRYIDLRVEDSPRPIEELQRLLTLQHAISLLNSAGRHHRAQEMDLAIADARKATELAPTNADTWYDLASYLALAGKKPEALAALVKALELNPRHKRTARSDKDLDALRGAPEFEKLLKER